MISERAFRMNFEEFQNQSRFYVVGALEPGEVEEFEREREKFILKALSEIMERADFLQAS